MPGATLATLLERNQAHVDDLEAKRVEAVHAGQSPPVVSVCCSDSRVPQEAMFGADEPGWLFAVGTIGNSARDRVDGEWVVDGNLLYPIQHTDTRTVAVVGHTGCGAVTAAYEAVTGQGGDLAAGIAKRVELIEPVVEEALETGTVDPAADKDQIVNQLVEANVHAQVEALVASPEVPDDADVYGFVYDLHGAYGDDYGRTILVNVQGSRDPGDLARAVPEGFEDSVATLLD